MTITVQRRRLILANCVIYPVPQNFLTNCGEFNKVLIYFDLERVGGCQRSRREGCLARAQNVGTTLVNEFVVARLDFTVVGDNWLWLGLAKSTEEVLYVVTSVLRLYR